MEYLYMQVFGKSPFVHHQTRCYIYNQCCAGTQIIQVLKISGSVDLGIELRSKC
jgi:hypothetical protein